MHDHTSNGALREQVEQILTSLSFPRLDISLFELLAKAPSWTDEPAPTLLLSFAVPVKHVAEDIALAVKSAVEAQGVALAAIEIEQQLAVAPAINASGTVSNVKNIIAVASGKGGVGKSTTAVNLALALACEGASVGLMDADIYGPSQSHMLGVAKQRPEVLEGRVIRPIVVHGVQMISMGNMVTDKTPMIWRGPMVSGALQQLLLNTQWNDVDYLIVDMPPGTGDIPLTLSQKVPVTGAVIVTTPQDIALLDAKKGIEMFQKVDIPVFGIVENMAVHICSQCGHEEHIFGSEGGEALAEAYSVDVLAKLPLAMSIREQTDSGKPPVVADPEAKIARIYRDLALKLAAELAQSASSAGPEIVIVDD